MLNSNKYKCKHLCGLAAFLMVVWLSMAIPQQLGAQNVSRGDIELQIELEEIVTKSQVLGLTTLGVDRRGEGQRLANMIIRNTTSERLENLYFHVKVSASDVGTIAELDQKSGQPFSLKPNANIFTNNNMLQNGIPQIDESLNFDGGLTNAGEQFVNDLGGSTRLPDHVYTLELNIFHGGNRLSGGQVVASASATIGSQPLSEVRDIYLRRPGGEIGSGTVVTTRYPEFSWDGEPNITYRIVVVESSSGTSPESLLQGAFSTTEVLRFGAPGSGSLLQYEMVDAIVDQTSFQYPSAGVQNLQDGNTYYWQIVAQLQTPGGVEEVYSEIWEFNMSNSSSGQSGGALSSEEMQQQVQLLIGPDLYQQLSSDGYQLYAIEKDGQTYQGPGMIPQLQTFIDRIEQGEISIMVEQ